MHAFCRITNEAITAEVSILGGITLKVLLPSDADALAHFLHKNDLELPSGPLTTIYRIEFKGTVYFCRAYKRVKKRNSYTILYLDNGQEKLAIIEYFLFVHHRGIAIIHCTTSIPWRCFDGRVWRDFQSPEMKNFLASPYCYLLTMNVDWFQPYKHNIYSLGAIYLTIQNLPRTIRYKSENIILVGIIPGPHEPSCTVNSYLTPLVQELQEAWTAGLRVTTPYGIFLSVNI